MTNNRTDLTDAWQLYLTGQDYNNRINYYAKTDLHWRFYNNDHWHGITTNGLPMAVFPIAKSAINYFVSAIMSQKVKAQYTIENIPDDATDPTEQEIKKLGEIITGYVDLKWEKDKMDIKLRQLLLDGANSGDFCAYVYWDANKETGQDEKGDFVTELVDGVNVMFGNPNNDEVESQPYILIVGREIASKLREEAKENGINEKEYQSIVPDEDNNFQAGQYGKIELGSNKDITGKSLYIIKFWKENGKVFWSKSTKHSPIRDKVELGISRYPVAWGNWDRIKNSYHGMAVMTGIIPNQIIINQLFAMVAYWMRTMAFGKTIIDKTRITNWTNKIGQVIESNGPINDTVHQLQAGNFNAAVMQVIDLAIKYTKDFIGASDAALGQVKPENTSAIIAVQKAATVPLENVQANLYQFVEDLALIWGEFIIKKYNNRKISYTQNGRVVVDNFNTQKHKDILLKAKIDVGPSSYWSEIASIQTLDNLLNNKHIMLVDYLERIPSGIIPRKQELISKLQQQVMPGVVQGTGQPQEQLPSVEEVAKYLDGLPPDIQSQLRQLPPDQIQQVVMEMVSKQI